MPARGRDQADVHAASAMIIEVTERVGPRLQVGGAGCRVSGRMGVPETNLADIVFGPCEVTLKLNITGEVGFHAVGVMLAARAGTTSVNDGDMRIPTSRCTRGEQSVSLPNGAIRRH